MNTSAVAARLILFVHKHSRVHGLLGMTAVAGALSVVGRS